MQSLSMNINKYQFNIPKYLLISLIFFFVALFGFAKSSHASTDLYFGQAAAGNHNGLDCANHRALSTLTWGIGNDIKAGDTLHLCGTITDPLTIGASGSAGNPITILFESGAKFSAPAFNDNAIIMNIASNSYITIDGGTTRTGSQIETTNNGSPDGNICSGSSCAYQRNFYGVSVAGGSNIIFQNLTINNLYARNPGSTLDTNRMGYPIDISGSNITIRNNILTGGDTMIAIAYGPGNYSNITVDNNVIGRCNHGMFVDAYQANSGTLDNLIISNNRINDLDVWNGVSGNHLDGMIISNDTPDGSGVLSNLKIFNNHIGPNIGNINTGAIFISGSSNNMYPSTYIYNNLFTARAPYLWSNGFIIAPGASAIYENTIVALAGGITMNLSGSAVAKNNLIYVDSPSCYAYVVNKAAVNSVTVDYNLYYCSGGDLQVWVMDPPNAASGYSYSDWKSLHGTDAHSLTSDPNFMSLPSSNYHLQSSSPAKDAGTPLLQPHNVDLDGVSRPQGSAWDIGAYEYVIRDTTPPAAPSGLSVN